MKGKPHYIKEWRKYRNLTQVQLTERIHIKQAHLSQIENYKRAYTQPILEQLAYALMCEPADLIMRNPLKPEAIWSIWDQVPETQRSQALTILKTFAEPEAERRKAG